MKKNICRAFALCFCFSACSIAADPPKHNHSKHEERGIVSMDLWSDGNTIHLLTVNLVPDQSAQLQFSRSSDAGESFSIPMAIAATQSPPDPIHRGMDAQIAAYKDNLIAVWTTAGKEDRFGRGPLATAVSSDGGASWQPGPNPSDFPQSIGHAFIDTAADAQGVFHLVWIDGRDRSGTGATPVGKGLRYARSSDHGKTWSANRTLDGATCECCWNSIAIGSENHLAVLYRNRDPRDMSIARSNDGGESWEPSIPVGTFDWNVNVCPHVGGGLAFATNSASELYATVWTGKAGAFGSYFLTSADGGQRWSGPIRLGSFQAMHTDLATGSDGQVALAWDVVGEKSSVIFATTSTDMGKTFLPPRQISEESAGASHPKILSTAAGFRVFWTQTNSEKVATVQSRKL